MTTTVRRMQLVIQKDGTVKFIYSDVLDLAGLGKVLISRASHVEPDEHGLWWADLSPASGPILGPFTRRSDAIAAEIAWLEQQAISRC